MRYSGERRLPACDARQPAEHDFRRQAACAPQSRGLKCNATARIFYFWRCWRCSSSGWSCFSAPAHSRDAHGDVYFFIKRQSLWLGIGLAALIAAALVDYHFWYHTWWLWFLLALGTLALCFVPHFGMRINGSRRWVGAGPITFQPS